MSIPRLAAAVLATLAILGLPTCSACSQGSVPPAPSPANGASTDPGDTQDDAGKSEDPTPPPILGYRILKTHPHDRSAYTQGLLWHAGHLYESTGRERESSLRRVDLETGKVLARHDLPPDYFAEGLARWKGLLIQLTWRRGEAIVYDAATFQELYRHSYRGEGWGLALAGDELVMSDGTQYLRVLDPKTFKEKRRVRVTYLDERTGARRDLNNLNELEWIDGKLWANLYQLELMAIIDLATGEVERWIDFTGLQRKQGVRDRIQDVQNGIAHDPETGRIFITGKYWPNLYEIELVEKR